MLNVECQESWVMKALAEGRFSFVLLNNQTNLCSIYVRVCFCVCNAFFFCHNTPMFRSVDE